jgi:lipopolysaccharide/colanic/teichoic acid biosynthesis glycosyltransferase
MPALEPKVREYLRARAAVEWFLAFALFVGAMPLLLGLGLAVRVTSEGPIFYSQWRVGRFGKPFRIYKLRTMNNRCEAHTGPVWAVADDPRTTRIGRWLRDSHLDELPQLWNVLCGHMSLIGPRPERPEIAAQIERTLPEFRHRLSVRPGITGLAQVRLPADSDLDTVRRKLGHDLYYIRNLGPLLDARVVLSTCFRLVGDLALSMSRRIARPIALPAPEARPVIAPVCNVVELRVAA